MSTGNVTPYQKELNEVNAKINNLERKHETTLLIISDRLHLVETTLVKHDLFIDELGNLIKNVQD